MSDLVAAPSLADNARRLAALARVKRESESETQDQMRFETQLSKLSLELAALKMVLATHRRLEAMHAPVDKLPDLTNAPKELLDQVARIGRPTWQYINGRVSSVNKTRAAVMEADAAAWKHWSLDQIDGLPLALLPRLGFERRTAELRVANLRKLASAAPTLGAMNEFQVTLRLVKDDLERVESAGVDAVLARFVQGRILLADLGEDELALLKSENALRTQLYLSLS